MSEPDAEIIGRFVALHDYCRGLHHLVTVLAAHLVETGVIPPDELARGIEATLAHLQEDQNGRYETQPLQSLLDQLRKPPGGSGGTLPDWFRGTFPGKNTGPGNEGDA